MLTIEQLICADQLHHKGCHWIETLIAYPDDKYPMLKASLAKKVRKSLIAHRIKHDTNGTLFTLKIGHDGTLYPKEK